MLFRDYQKSFVEFCNEEIVRIIVLAKRKYLREEKKNREQCVLLDEDYLLEEIYLDYEKEFEEVFDLFDNIEDERILKAMKLLSPKERKVVSLRLKDIMSMDEINIILGTSRRNTSIEIYSRAIRKIKTNLDKE